MCIINKINELPWHPTRRWGARDLSDINKIVIHQELGEGSVEAVNNYHIQPNHISQSGCPHFCYHYGIEKDGSIIQANALQHVTWHTGGHNKRAVGIMLVGNFQGLGHDKASAGPTDAQMRSLKGLVAHLLKELKLDPQDVFGHYHFGKPACPGHMVQGWIEEFRGHTATADKSIRDIQQRLNELGYEAGPVDGIQGMQTIKAIRAFQEKSDLLTDGIPGPQTLKALFR